MVPRSSEPDQPIPPEREQRTKEWVRFRRVHHVSLFNRFTRIRVEDDEVTIEQTTEVVSDDL